MPTLILRRVLATVPVLFIVTFLTFAASTKIRPDPAVRLAGGAEFATAEAIAEKRHELGFDRPILTRYREWLGDALRFDFGTSIFDELDVDDQIRAKLPVTISIVILALLEGLLIAVPIGVMSGMRPGRVADRLGIGGTILGISVPNFVAGILLSIVFAVHLQWLPGIGFTRFSESPLEWLRYAILPATALALGVGAIVARQLRGALIDTMGSNYVRTAWATGGSPRQVVGKHALKNAAIPAVTAVGLQVGVLVAATVLVERVFGIPGLGAYYLAGLQQQDVPVILGVTVFFVLLQVGIGLVLDIAYGLLNPKVRLS